MKFLKWLYPGLGVKRWLLVALCGIIMATVGLSLVMESQGILIITAISKYFNYLYFNSKTALLTGSGLLLLGFVLMLTGLQKILLSILNAILPYNENKLVEVVYQNKQLKKGPKIVALGGGTGLSMLLRGLKNYTTNLTAIVTVTDDGGSSGRLRGELGMLPPGDVRNCLLALADQESLMEKVLNYRFNQGEELKGHNLGNLLLAALTQVTGDFYSAIQEISRVLAIKGSVLPATLQSVVLGAKMANGDTVLGETEIVQHKSSIKEVFLSPADCKPLEGALEAIYDADAIILGPGSLYTSVIPNLLVKGIKEAVISADCPVFYVCNIMTQPGETDGYTAQEHLQAIQDHIQGEFIDYIIVNTERIPEKLLKRYKNEGAEPVKIKEKALKEAGVKVLKASLLQKEDYVRHDSDVLARLIVGEIIKLKPTYERVKMFDLND